MYITGPPWARGRGFTGESRRLPSEPGPGLSESGSARHENSSKAPLMYCRPRGALRDVPRPRGGLRMSSGTERRGGAVMLLASRSMSVRSRQGGTAPRDRAYPRGSRGAAASQAHSTPLPPQHSLWRERPPRHAPHTPLPPRHAPHAPLPPRHAPLPPRHAPLPPRHAPHAPLPPMPRSVPPATASGSFSLSPTRASTLQRRRPGGLRRGGRGALAP
jgi:hypothetical protein